MAVDMTPQPEDSSINLPITFDYRGGRNENKKNKVLLTIVTVFVSIILSVLMLINNNLLMWQRLLYTAIVLYVGLLILRFVIFKESYFSDIFETLKKKDYTLDLDNIWQIFDIESTHPYLCYFKNGQKGVFVRMEKDVITGKPETAIFNHYEAIGDAYNVAHSLNMNIIHIDYMDNVGNDSRMQKMYDDLAFVDNPDMQMMLSDIYNNLQDEMSRNYSCFDIYLFLTRDNTRNFRYNVETVARKMLGGNFITYKMLDKYEISRVCTALFNLHDFSIAEACESTLTGYSHSGIIPLNVVHGDGSIEVFNKTVAEKKALAEEEARRQQENMKNDGKRSSRQASSGKGEPRSVAIGNKPTNSNVGTRSTEISRVKNTSSSSKFDEDAELDLFKSKESNQQDEDIKLF